VAPGPPWVGGRRRWRSRCGGPRSMWRSLVRSPRSIEAGSFVFARGPQGSPPGTRSSTSCWRSCRCLLSVSPNLEGMLAGLGTIAFILGPAGTARSRWRRRERPSGPSFWRRAGSQASSRRGLLCSRRGCGPSQPDFRSRPGSRVPKWRPRRSRSVAPATRVAIGLRCLEIGKRDKRAWDFWLMNGSDRAFWRRDRG